MSEKRLNLYAVHGHDWTDHFIAESANQARYYAVREFDVEYIDVRAELIERDVKGAPGWTGYDEAEPVG